MKHRIIDLDKKKTEAGWQRGLDVFFITAIPKWFEFLNWLVILGLFRYLVVVTDNLLIKLIYYLSIIGLYKYIEAMIFNIRFKSRGFSKLGKYRRVISFTLSFLVITLIFQSLNIVVKLITLSYHS